MGKNRGKRLKIKTVLGFSGFCGRGFGGVLQGWGKAVTKKVRCNKFIAYDPGRKAGVKGTMYNKKAAPANTGAASIMVKVVNSF
ncbi:hypothetical protein A3860_27295 [Niastella vici]|uniref:Uncharacterized protein n=1 Tax=Niastella vici TaxID=1703345 RepID=A0A1V9FWQ4_9BACT|nr:hypothetical protein A3860_27295 [Niastella vici]